MAALVYKLFCELSGKSYIGITSRSLDTRWLEHCSRARQNGREESRLYAAMRKYGLDAFTREVIATTDTDDEARSLERFYILQFDTYANGYNANEGGHGHLHLSPELRKKIGDAQRGKFIPEETRERMSEAKIGDPRCALNFGEHTQKGEGNPRAKTYLVENEDGRLFVTTGLRQFCRENNLQPYKLSQTMAGTRKSHKGYKILSILGVNADVAAPAQVEG